MDWRHNLLLTALACCTSTTLHADIIADALLSFPARTEYFEYDNIRSLRILPNYTALRQNYSGKSLDEAKMVLNQLGIEEGQVDEVVSGSGSSTSYGLFSGTFSVVSAAKNGRLKGLAVKLPATQAFCAGKETCIIFLQDSLAAFGSVDRLKEMLEARQGAMPRLTSNRSLVALLNSVDQRAPVRGILCGSQLKASLSELLQEWTGWKTDWSTLSGNLSGIGYAVIFDSKAHVSAKLECTSRTAAVVLLQMLSALGAVQSAANAPFQNLQVSSSGNFIFLRVDSVVPALGSASR